ncbi:hypothetical protein I5Q34_02825 [Streptomyces sp. AV19]|uniref:hypothetical protein n=1 Tax=Streptomyces sp. AV19 TaxID=2793068 RepID=UPI0018FE603E|nr:hypothetical protein [Streptomyces sp. AV19]MBH1933231.1 hypothetical protein [Streptomyces sp. AV19]MDG4530669.1 hypothetical protein [Streptomyces sp. AV19]
MRAGGLPVVGEVGRVTGAIGPGLVGEVMLRVRGGAEAFLAYAIEEGERLARGTLVVVVEYQPPRTVYVAAAYG